MEPTFRYYNPSQVAVIRVHNGPKTRCAAVSVALRNWLYQSAVHGIVINRNYRQEISLRRQFILWVLLFSSQSWLTHLENLELFFFFYFSFKQNVFQLSHKMQSNRDYVFMFFPHQPAPQSIMIQDGSPIGCKRANHWLS